MHADGYTHLLIQPSTVIDGVEMESLEGNAAELAGLFKEIRIGNPLLYDPEDYSDVIDILTKDNRPQTAYIWVGHGTYDVNTAQYAMLDYMLKEKGYKNCIVGTIEGYPTFENALSQLKASGLKQVTLRPFMLVAGEHAKNDIAEKWKEKLEQAGFTVEVRMEGLGENSQIQERYLSHLNVISRHRKINIQDKKKIYEKTGEVMHE